MSDSPLIVLGVITGAHGVRGAVRIKPFTDEMDGLTAYGALFGRDGTRFELNVIGQSKGQILATIKGITDRNQVDALKGVELCVPRNALPDPQDGEFYIEDLRGLRVLLEDGSEYGTVRSVQNYGAGDIVDIQRPDGKTELLAFDERTFPQVDIANGLMRCVLPDVLTVSSEEH